MKRMLTRIIAVVLTAVFLIPSAGALAFSDIGKDEWYSEYIDELVSKGIINGYSDGTFRPQKTLTRGEFLKMLVCAVCPDKVVISGTGHWAFPYYAAARGEGILQGSAIANSGKNLDAGITRYEMAVLLTQTVLHLLEEPRLDTSPLEEGYISDLDNIPSKYADSVLQAYAKGILTGYEDCSFSGEKFLTRSEAATVIIRLLDKSLRIATPCNGGDSGPPKIDTPLLETGYEPLAYRSKSELAKALFGNENRWFPKSEAMARSRLTEITVDVWRLSSDGSKYSDTETIEVNSAVADEVKEIFRMIYEGKEKFPICSIGGFGCNETAEVSEHMWGVAIDINAEQNYCCSSDGTAIAGSYWEPYSDPYSITPYGDVVRAFSAFGWVWGGKGGRNGTKDYMHFSITGN